jgi:hypothetical protein
MNLPSPKWIGKDKKKVDLSTFRIASLIWDGAKVK